MKKEVIVKRIYDGKEPRERIDCRIEKRWMHQGLECAVVQNGLPDMPSTSDIRTWRCGYVGLPKGHRMFGKEYDIMNNRIDVHGGLTFSQSGDGLIWTEGLWWVGFDTVHICDTPEEWTLSATIAETERLAKQLKRMMMKRRKKRAVTVRGLIA